MLVLVNEYISVIHSLHN